jgi:glucose dehydrogenase
LRVTVAMLSLTLAGAAVADAPASGEWPTSAGDPQGTRFSPLEQINSRNVGSLKLAFSFATGNDKGHEAAPLVVGDTMYLVTPYPNTVYALDLRQPTTTVKWKFDPKPQASSQGVACCDVVNRGAPTRTGGSSSTRSTCRRSRSMPRAAASSGARSSATSRAARR